MQNKMKYRDNAMRSNPRIIVEVNDESVNCRGVYIDSKDNTSSFTRSFNDELQCMDYLDSMRENGCEFSIQVNRTNWK